MKYVGRVAIRMGVLAVLLAAPSGAQTPGPGLTATVAVEKTQYLLSDPGGTDPIVIDVMLRNISGQNVIASHKLQDLPLPLVLVFTDPDGKPILATEASSTGGEGQAPLTLPVQDQLVQVEVVDVLPATYLSSVRLPNARAYYSFVKSGTYSVRAIVAARTYPGIFQSINQVDYAQLDAATFQNFLPSNAVQIQLVGDTDQDGYAFPVPDSRLAGTHPTLADCNDTNPAINPGAPEILNNGLDDDCNPATPDVLVVQPPTPGAIALTAEKHTVGAGSQPTTSKTPIAGMVVRAYNRASGSCASQIGFFPNKAQAIVLSCPAQQTGVTDSGGLVSLAVPPGTYQVIGEYDPNGSATSTGARDGDERYPDVPTGPVASGQTVQKKLQLIVKANGNAVPGKTTARTGSQLLIIEPAYVEWDGAQELYPFIFETQGDWTVTTSVAPPPGFVADQNAITTTVNTALKAAQFTITDVGSDWTPTGVTHKLKHKGKTETIKSEIGVRLSEKLAQAKGLTRLGKKK